MSAFGVREAEFIARLAYENKQILTSVELETFLPSNYPYLAKLIYQLKNKGILTLIKRGFYLYTPLEAVTTGRRVNEFLIPSLFLPGQMYYIGYSTMYNYYGLTEQMFQTVYVLNSSLSKVKIICGITYNFKKVPESSLYGIDKLQVEGSDVLVSSLERTLLDLLYYNKPVGGIVPAMSIFRETLSLNRCDLKKLIQYATQFPNITTRKQVGVILDQMGYSKLLNALAASVKNSALSSLGGSRKGRIDKKWKAIIDVA